LFSRHAEALERHRKTLAAAHANLRAARLVLKIAEKAVEDATFARAFLEAVAKERAP
jgi:hypothetical protein